jgi:hypothetical protein
MAAIMFDLQGLDGDERSSAFPLRATVEQLRGLPDALMVTDEDILQEGEAPAALRRRMTRTSWNWATNRRQGERASLRRAR